MNGRKIKYCSLGWGEHLDATRPLFRQEAIGYRTDRLHGSVSLATPLAWQFIGFLLLVAFASAIFFLATASYARVETVDGAVVLDKGIATIVPSRAGIVSSIVVREGQDVRAGALLAEVRAEEDMAGGVTAPQRVREALAMQDDRLARQGNLLLRAADAESARLRAEMAGLGEEIAGLEAQIADQHRLVDAATADFRKAQTIAQRGFISGRDLQNREATLLLRRQQLAQLQQSRAGKRSDLREAARAIDQSMAQAQAQAANADSNRAQLLQQIAQADSAQGYTLTAPVSGRVTALIARVGQAAASDRPMMTIVPRDATPGVELQVPTSAAGFLAPGQEVRLAIDAFPYQRFGTVVGRIAQISSAAIARQGPNGPVPVYLVNVDLDESSVRVFGRRQSLLPGMTLKARIVTEKRTLLEWLFEPIFAVRNR